MTQRTAAIIFVIFLILWIIWGFILDREGVHVDWDIIDEQRGQYQ